FGIIHSLKIFNNQSFDDVTSEDNMSFEYEGISNFENNLYKNVGSDGNIIDDENVTDNDDNYTEDKEDNTTKSLPITSYFTSCEVFMPRTSTTNIVAHLCTEHQIFITQKWEAQPSLTSTTILTATN
ncbi:4222_t:CDS:2, partial [Cetraspora pellucida]